MQWARGEGSKKNQISINKKTKSRDQKKQHKDQKTKVLENGESFKDWGSRVQGRGSKKNKMLHDCESRKDTNDERKSCKITEIAPKKMEYHDTCCGEK